MRTQLTKPIIIPHWNEGTVELFRPDPAGTPILDTAFNINLKNVLTHLGIINGSDGNPAIAAGNGCTLKNNDLYVANSSPNSQRIFKFPNYITNPSAAIANSSILSRSANDYVGLVFDNDGNLYSSEGYFGNNNIVRYDGGAGSGKIIIDGGGNSYFANMVFDGDGNLWVTDYNNSRLIVIKESDLNNPNAPFVVLNNLTASIPVSNTDNNLNGVSNHLFAKPEGIAIDAVGNLWIANNNDEGDGGLKNDLTSLVKITMEMQKQVMAPGVTEFYPTIGSNFFVYNVQNIPNPQVPPNPLDPPLPPLIPHLGGMQIDKEAGRIYVNDEIGGYIRFYDIATIHAISIAGLPSNILPNITVSNPGNGGMVLAYDMLADIYIRDNLDDHGIVPTLGALSMSPDICHFNESFASKTDLGLIAAFNDINSQPKCDDIVPGINYLYVRLQNKGSLPDVATVTLYYIEPSSFPTPANWRKIIPIITVPPITVSPGSVVKAGPFLWDASGISPGHYCFVAIIDTDNEPLFDINAINTIDDYINFIRLNNKVAWKNFDVVNAASPSRIHFAFQLYGWHIKEIQSDLQINLNALPTNTTAEIKILSRIAENATFIGLEKKEDTKTQSIYHVKAGISALIQDLYLKPNDAVNAELTVNIPEAMPDGAYDIAVIQKVEGAEVGRITRRINVGKFPYIGNTNSMEVHESNCVWAHKISTNHRTFFQEVDTAIKQQYDGCATCLPDLNHG